MLKWCILNVNTYLCTTAAGHTPRETPTPVHVSSRLQDHQTIAEMPKAIPHEKTSMQPPSPPQQTQNSSQNSTLSALFSSAATPHTAGTHTHHSNSSDKPNSRVKVSSDQPQVYQGSQSQHRHQSRKTAPASAQVSSTMLWQSFLPLHADCFSLYASIYNRHCNSFIFDFCWSC